MENAPKITLEQIQAPIADRIRSYERYIASILHSDNAYVGSISDYILGNRGKQLRRCSCCCRPPCTARSASGATWARRWSR